LVRALKLWADNRFAGDEEIFAVLESWYYGDKPKPSANNGHRHLYEWQENLRDQVQRHRREIYRCFAADLVKRYGRVYLEEFDLREVVERPNIEEATAYDDAVRGYRAIAAISELRMAIRNACERVGAKLESKDASYTTHICPDCSSSIEFAAALQLRCTCPGCGREHDQDHMAARNILARGKSTKESPEPLAVG
jgi:transposase